MSSKTPGDARNESDVAPHGAGACGCHHLEHDLREAGNRLLDQTKGLRAELAKQAQEHPLATFGLAFAAGLLVARALRR